MILKWYSTSATTLIEDKYVQSKIHRMSSQNQLIFQNDVVCQKPTFSDR